MLNIETYKIDLFPNLIERVWRVENTDEDIELMIPPNQYVSWVFPLKNSKYWRNHVLIDTPQIEGISTKTTSLNYPKGTQLIGVRFFAFGLYPFVQTHGKKIINNSIEFPPETESLRIQNLLTCDSNAIMIDEVTQLLKALFDKKRYEEITMMMEFYSQFRWNDEIFSIEEYCRNARTNYTTLNRKFARIVGITTKKFERLIKFRKSLCWLMDRNDKLTSISADSGYFDQAHFIREFKFFINQTPSAYKSFIKMADKESKIINYNFKLF